MSVLLLTLHSSRFLDFVGYFVGYLYLIKLNFINDRKLPELVRSYILKNDGVMRTKQQKKDRRAAWMFKHNPWWTQAKVREPIF